MPFYFRVTSLILFSYAFASYFLLILGPKSTEETIAFGLFEECSRQTRDSEVEFGHWVQRGFGVSRWIPQYCNGTNARVWIGRSIEGNIWGLLYSRKQRSAHFITKAKNRSLNCRRRNRFFLLTRAEIWRSQWRFLRWIYNALQGEFLSSRMIYSTTSYHNRFYLRSIYYISSYY